MSGRMYQHHDWTKPYVLRIDDRPEKTEVEELFENPQPHIAVAVSKRFEQAYYRTACLNGAPHPLGIERQLYTLVTVATRSIEKTVFAQGSDVPSYSTSNRFSPTEMDFINSVQNDAAVEWAVDNSFDGIYVQKYEAHSSFATEFRFAVYMKDEQVTFWTLKFSGQ